MTPPLRQILDDVLAGHRLTEEEAVRLLSTRDRGVWEIAAAADELREQKVGDVVTYVRNQNINVTNLCVNACGFCGFSRKSGDTDVFYHNEATVREKARMARERSVTEVCTVSGLHPEFDAQSYVDIYSWIRDEAPGAHIHASNPMEVAYAAKRSGLSTREVLMAMQTAGLGTLCGTAAEILVDSVRAAICPDKIDTATWVRVIKEAHGLGIRSTATIMYGHCETGADRARHFAVLREIQDDTGGFTEFVPLSFIHQNTPLYRAGLARPGATGREDILMFAVSRLFLDNIDHIQTSWVKLGTKMAGVALLSGADDLGGTLFEESISREAGARDTDYLDPAEMRRMAEDLGRTLRQRTTIYTLLPG
ncbi:MAG: 7,8-didemethyl-8-hydroxy-5-deazariboflavin synthase subunit CofH [Methanomicrobiales archaeon HGW-Methanomicrobiales-2]|jgi:FO synthase subunit 2|nr:MAG: 7,8-didemethyl-8-hydroxy-5-deazariboflavin synthase subunit CofH [Methanomicrobiales archaeon HGW-Methanomicrobiales-2]